jgi:thiol-disulfide isomerase/thioredoxin
MIKNVFSKRTNPVSLLLFAVTVVIGAYYYSKYRMAPDIVAENILLSDKSARSFDFSELNDKNVLLIFFASWCGPCVQEMYYLEELKKELGIDDFRYVALSDEPYETIERFQLRTQSSFEFYRTVEKMKQLGIFTFPTAYIINKNGEIIFEHVGNYAWQKPETTEKIRTLINK